MKKRLFAVICAGCIAFALTACKEEHHNPCEDSCDIHASANSCHCHGHCGTEGCECHHAH